MLVIHFTPHTIGTSVNTGNVASIFNHGLRKHSSVCTMDEVLRYKHHGLRSNRKSQWGMPVSQAAVILLEVECAEPGCDGPGHLYNKSVGTPLAWSIIDNSTTDAQLTGLVWKLSNLKI